MSLDKVAAIKTLQGNFSYLDLVLLFCYFENT